MIYFPSINYVIEVKIIPKASYVIRTIVKQILCLIIIERRNYTSRFKIKEFNEIS